MASAALLADTGYIEARPSGAITDRFLGAQSSRFISDRPAPRKFSTGLTDDLAITTSDPANPLLVSVLARLHELKALSNNWDGYGASAVSAKVFRPVLDLLVDAMNRCAEPTVVPLPEGGLGLRFADADKELEIDVHPNGKVDALCAGDVIGEDIEREGVSLSDAKELLLRYCRA